MILTLKNIGRFYNEARIEINGITIVAGENGTGKSTIGKSLYCTFNSLYDIKNKVYRSRIDAVRIKLMKASRGVDRKDAQTEFDVARHIVERNESKTDKQLVQSILETSDYPFDEIDNREKEKLLDDIIEILGVEENSIVRSIVERSFFDRFGGMLQHANHTDEAGSVTISVRGASIRIEDTYGAEFIVQEYVPLMKDILYIDDEFSLENCIHRYNAYYGYEDSLREKIVLRKKDNVDVVGEMLYEERYKVIIDRMNQENIGELIKEKGRDFEYKEKGLNTRIAIENVSSGTKILVLLKQLIINGYLEDNGIIVLDEPEIHLHPKWQRMLAEVIVLMQVEFGINILISTHSSDFVAFIQYYSKKHDITNKNKAYLITSGAEKYTSEVKDVTDEMDEIYRMLGEPFIEVSEDLEYGF